MTLPLGRYQNIILLWSVSTNSEKDNSDILLLWNNLANLTSWNMVRSVGDASCIFQISFG